jgi:nitrate/TMAO reductase-like tetraheme cytochrome c subunit
MGDKKLKFILLTLFLTLNLSAQVLKKREMPPRSKDCQLCHIKRQNQEVFVPKKNATQKEHFEIQVSHGSLKKSCNDCHDINNSNLLFSPATFENTSVLCFRCHIERSAEWQNGVHGKKSGSWKNVTIYQCIDCHDPHSVSIKKMEAKPAPIIRFYEPKVEAKEEAKK